MCAMPFDGNSQSFETTAVRPNCELCPASRHCMIAGMPRDAVSQWNALVQSHVSLADSGRTLFAANDPVTAIYVVRAGCVKTVTIDDEGNERVRGFHLPGDLVGLDALGCDRYPSSAVAVVASQVCRVAKASIMQKIVESPLLAQRLLQRISRDLAHSQALAGDYNADQRVAAFLLNMHERLNPLPGAPAKLPMTRGDIANYLRLATETVCRVMTRLAAKGLIQSDDRKIRLLKPAPMYALAGPVGICRQFSAAA
jgi:CRP/FNR family transcriptional regulator, anaerobic regulatory protein